MPKDTFYRLAEEKKNRILNAAKKEFFRVPYDEASINQIIKNAEIPRGSFYQYFVDKQDVFCYVLAQIHEKVISTIHQDIIEKEGDIFLVVYDYIQMIETCYPDNTCETFLSNLTNPEVVCVINGILHEDNVFDQMEHHLEDDLKKYIDFSLYKVEKEEESYFVEILAAIIKEYMRKMFCNRSIQEIPVKEICEQTRKQIAFFEKIIRK